MSVAIGSLKIDESFTGAETKYTLPVNLAGRTIGDLFGIATTNNVTVTPQISTTGNESGPFTEVAAKAVVFAAATPNVLSLDFLTGWVRFKMVSAGNATFSGAYRSNPVAQ